MKKLVVASAVIAAMGLSTAALAGGPDEMNQAPQPKGSIVFGGDLGYGWGNDQKSQQFVNAAPSTLINTSNSNDHLVFGGHLGYRYAIMPALKLGLEAGYLHFGDTDSKATNPNAITETNKYTVKQQALTFLATASYDVYQGLNVFGKFGPAVVFQNLKYTRKNNGVTVANQSFDESNTKVAPFVSVGAGYTFHSIELDVAYDHLFGDKSKGTDVKWPSVANPTASDHVYSVNAVVASLSYALPI